MNRDAGAAVQMGEIEFELPLESDLKNDKQSKEIESLNKEISNLNTALKILTDLKAKDLAAAQDDLLIRINKFIIPEVNLLISTNLNEHQTCLLNRIKFLLDNIASINLLNEPTISLVFDHNRNKLTQRELTIFNLVRDGKSTKEIVNILRISKSSVLTHRHHIRKKFGLVNTKINFRTHALYEGS